MKNNNFFLALLATLTLGLAPFTPEPHFFEKIHKVLGGAVGMKPIDWFDLVLHGAPWVWLAIESFKLVRSKIQKS